jgi:hypothetical protein
MELQHTMSALESAVLSAWYCSRPEVRRLLAFKDAEGLRVLLQLEPAQDSDETHPAWMANRREWADELQWHTGTHIRLEHLANAAAEDREVVVADLCWRDPSLEDALSAE